MQNHCTPLYTSVLQLKKIAAVFVADMQKCGGINEVSEFMATRRETHKRGWG
jgi:hypothetical protein